MGQTEPNSQFFADFRWFLQISLFLGITALRRCRFSQKTAGNRRFSQKTERKPQIFAKTGLSHLVCPFPWSLPFLGVLAKTKEDHPKHQGSGPASKPRKTPRKPREKQRKTPKTPRNFLGQKRPRKIKKKNAKERKIRVEFLGNGPNTVSESTVSNTELSEFFELTDRVFRRTHRVCPKTQWGSVSSLLRNSTLETVFRPFPTFRARQRSGEGVVRRNGRPKGCFWRVRFYSAPLKFSGPFRCF